MTYRKSRINRISNDLKKANEKEEDVRYETLDWMNETYQLACRQYRQSLGLVNMDNYESDYQCESERRYWEEFHIAHGGEPYKPVRYHCDISTNPARHWQTPLQIIPDPPQEWLIDWLVKQGIEFRHSPQPKTSEEYQQRLEAFRDRMNIRQRERSSK